MVSCISLYKKFPEGKNSRSWMQIVAVLWACIPSLNFGMHIAWTSPSIPLLLSNETAIDISFEETSYLSIIQNAAIIVSCPIFALLVDYIGRRNTILFVSVPYLIAWLMIAFSKTKYELYAAKCFAGIGDAALFSSLPLYIGEICEPHIRGSWGNAATITLFTGQLCINAIGSYVNLYLTAVICSTLSIVHFAFFPFVPESPYFLIMKNKKEAAEHSLKILRWKSDVRDELEGISKGVQKQLSESKSLKDIFTEETNRKALLIATGIRCVQQFSGVSAFIVYTQTFFEEAGGTFSKEVSSMIFCIVTSILMTLASLIQDRVGRKLSMILSTSGCATILIILGVYFYLKENYILDLSNISWFPLVGMIIYLIFLAAGLGLLPTLMTGELFSANIKAKAASLLCIVLASCQLVTAKIFQSLVYYFGLYSVLLFFGLCTACSVVFSYFCVPETAGKTLEEVQQLLTKKSPVDNKNVK